MTPGDQAGASRPLRDVAVGAGLALLGASLWLYAIPTWMPEPPGLAGPAMSPQFLPRLVAVLLVVLGLALALLAWLGQAPAARQAEGSAARGLAVVLTALALYLGLAELLGAALVAVLVTIGLLLLRGERRWPVLLLAGAIVPVGVVLLLERLGKVPLPAGPFGL